MRHISSRELISYNLKEQYLKWLISLGKSKSVTDKKQKLIFLNKKKLSVSNFNC